MAPPDNLSIRIPLYKLPPPFKIPPLPEPDNSRNFPIEKYWKVARDPDYPFDELDLNNDILKKVVLNEIAQRPEIWCTRSSAAIQKGFPAVAVETFKRTGILLSLASIKTIHKCAKDNLRNRLRMAVVKKRLTPMQVEQYMWTWDFYPYIRHYRDYTKSWELDLLKEIHAIDEMESLRALKNKRARMFEGGGYELPVVEAPLEDNLDDIVVEERNYDDDDDIIWDNPPPPESNTPSSSGQLDFIKTELTEFVGSVPDPEYYNSRKREYGFQDVYQNEESSSSPVFPPPPQQSFNPSHQPQKLLKPNVNSDQSCSPSSSSMTAAVDFEREMSQIAYQATRIAREQPEKVRLLRKALFDTVLAFDQKEYRNVKDLYKDLYEKN